MGTSEFGLAPTLAVCALAHPRGAQLTRCAEVPGEFCRSILSGADRIDDDAALPLREGQI